MWMRMAQHAAKEAAPACTHHSQLQVVVVHVVTVILEPRLTLILVTIADEAMECVQPATCALAFAH